MRHLAGAEAAPAELQTLGLPFHLCDQTFDDLSELGPQNEGLARLVRDGGDQSEDHAGVGEPGFQHVHEKRSGVVPDSVSIAESQTKGRGPLLVEPTDPVVQPGDCGASSRGQIQVGGETIGLGFRSETETAHIRPAHDRRGLGAEIVCDLDRQLVNGAGVNVVGDELRLVRSTGGDLTPERACHPPAEASLRACATVAAHECDRREDRRDRRALRQSLPCKLERCGRRIAGGVLQLGGQRREHVIRRKVDDRRKRPTLVFRQLRHHARSRLGSQPPACRPLRDRVKECLLLKRWFQFRPKAVPTSPTARPDPIPLA